jgi:hypothetical protein
MTFKYDIDDPLAFMPNESEKANKVLNDYALMGVARSFQKLIDRYKRDNQEVINYKKNPAGWEKGKPIPLEAPTVRMTTFATWSKKYSWIERVEVWDGLERARERKEFEADRIEWKRRRLDLLKATFFKLVQLLEKIDAKTAQADIGTITKSIKEIGEQMRIELGENTPALLMNLDFDDPNIPLEVLEKIIQGDASAITELLALRNKP